MANNNGIIYIDTSTSPHKGVCIADIQTVLDSSRNDIGGLITYGAIKPWAKYKPVVYASMGTSDQMEEDTTNDIMKWKSTSNWWKGTSGYCGFDIPSYASAADLDGETDIWEYVRPNGTLSTQPFRFFDFNLYDHNSIVPFSLRLPDTVVVRMATIAQIVYESSPATYNLALTDIDGFADCYFGIAAFKDNNTPQFITASKKLSANDVDSNKINLQNLSFFQSAGIVRLYAFIGSYKQESFTSQYEHSAWFLNPEGEMGYREVQVIERAETVYVHAIGGFSAADRKVLGQATISVTAGTFFATRSKVGTRDFSKIYTLTSVVATAKLHSTGEVVATQTLSLSSCGPDLLEPGDPQGTSYTFYAPVPAWSPALPTILDPTDYYEITMTFNYA